MHKELILMHSTPLAVGLRN